MIPKELYPTPENVARKMLRLVDFNKVETILEPSAGYGDLAMAAVKEYNEQYCRRSSHDKKSPFPAEIIDLVEIDEKCRAFLKSKSASVIADDFLTLKTFKRYDLIIMNPPFSDGVKHLLKAIEMQRYGGQIVCLLNSETVKNPYTLERKVLIEKIEQYGGKVYDYGACFANSERPTDVNVCCVYIDIPKGFRSDILDGLEKAKEAEEQSPDECGQLSAELDEYMRAVVGQYQRECEAGLKLINEYNAVSRMALTSFTDKYKSSILELKIQGSGSGSIENRYLEKVRYKYWEAFFGRPEICGKMTGEMQNEFLSRLDELKRVEFNLDNIYDIQIKLSKSTLDSVEKAIMDLFHEFSRDYSWYPECANNMSLNYEPMRKIADIEKVFSYLDTGITDCWESVSRIMSSAENAGQSQNIEFRYFFVTFYKKGTAHIIFKDMELLKRFNIFAGRKEGGLPPSYGKKSYGDMSGSEKAVIDEFEGEESYGEVYANPDKFLVTAENLLALT